MLDKLSIVLNEVLRFSNKHHADAEFYIHSVEELKDGTTHQDERWTRFEKNAGVYCFFDEDAKKVKYIGMSLKDTGSRLFGWLFIEDSKVNKAISDNDIILHVVLKDDAYIAPALEAYLISKISTELNVTGVTKR